MDKLNFNFLLKSHIKHRNNNHNNSLKKNNNNYTVIKSLNNSRTLSLVDSITKNEIKKDLNKNHNINNIKQNSFISKKENKFNKIFH